MRTINISNRKTKKHSDDYHYHLLPCRPALLKKSVPSWESLHCSNDFISTVMASFNNKQPGHFVALHPVFFFCSFFFFFFLILQPQCVGSQINIDNREIRSSLKTVKLWGNNATWRSSDSHFWAVHQTCAQPSLCFLLALASHHYYSPVFVWAPALVESTGSFLQLSSRVFAQMTSEHWTQIKWKMIVVVGVCCCCGWWRNWILVR